MADPRRLLPATQQRSLEQAVAVLQSGGVVVLPTDTVYGLGAHALIPEAIELLFTLKGREHQKAIAVLLARAEDVHQVAVAVPDVAWQLGERFWPGPLTLVLPRSEGLPNALTGGGPSIAVRVPDHVITRYLIGMLAVPLAATSANLAGQSEAVTAEDAYSVFGDQVQIYLDGGRCPGGVASTVVDLTADPPLIRRRGPIGNEVEAFLAQRK